MKTLVLYYSFTGNTRALAKKLAEENGWEAVEIKEAKKRSVFSAFAFGCPMAIHYRASELAPVSIDFSDVEKVVVASPIWAACPAPAFNAIISLLPQGMKVEIAFTSSGGSNGKCKQAVTEKLSAMGLELLGISDYISQKK